MIYRFQPFATNKLEFGKIINAHCASVNSDEDWIQIMDWDAMILCTETYHVIDKAIEAHPNTEIFGAMTNRVGYPWQRWNTEMSSIMDIAYHINLAKGAAKLFPNGEYNDVTTLAGFFLLFKKKYWLKNNFPEKIISNKGRTFDKFFCDGAKDMKVILGAYIFHQYRIMGDYTSNKHLK